MSSPHVSDEVRRWRLAFLSGPVPDGTDPEALMAWHEGVVLAGHSLYFDALHAGDADEVYEIVDQITASQRELRRLRQDGAQ